MSYSKSKQVNVAQKRRTEILHEIMRLSTRNFLFRGLYLCNLPDLDEQIKKLCNELEYLDGLLEVKQTEKLK